MHMNVYAILASRCVLFVNQNKGCEMMTRHKSTYWTVCVPGLPWCRYALDTCSRTGTSLQEKYSETRTRVHSIGKYVGNIGVLCADVRTIAHRTGTQVEGQGPRRHTLRDQPSSCVRTSYYVRVLEVGTFAGAIASCPGMYTQHTAGYPYAISPHHVYVQAAAYSK